MRMYVVKRELSEIELRYIVNEDYHPAIRAYQFHHIKPLIYGIGPVILFCYLHQSIFLGLFQNNTYNVEMMFSFYPPFILIFIAGIFLSFLGFKEIKKRKKAVKWVKHKYNC